MSRLLLVEDDERLGGLMANYLGQNGFTVEWERDGTVARDRILNDPPELVVLDWMLPGEDGLSICRAVRPRFTGPILMLTARGDEIDQVLGLEMGADDYVAKPVSPRLLLARIRALLRRKTPAAAERIVDGELVIDRARRLVSVGGEALELTTAEFELLRFMARRAGRPVSRDALFEGIRGIPYDGIDRSMDVRMSKLRRKLDAASGQVDLIKTVRGVGYQYTGAPPRQG